MKQNNSKTNVLFLIEKPEGNLSSEVFAYFPDENYNLDSYGPKMKTSYSHIGQHSACDSDYANKCKKATLKQYQDLKTELENQGYNLNVLNVTLNRQEILNKFFMFFVDSKQTKQDRDQNYSDLQKMTNSQLIKQYNAFFN